METTATAARRITFGRPVHTVALIALLLGLVYSLVLAWAERRLPIIPDYITAEVMGGVLISLIPVALAARHEARFGGLSWRIYEQMVAVAFIGTGVPIVAWQVVEYILRHHS